MTSHEQSIVLVSIFGTIMNEYKGSKITKGAKELLKSCNTFMANNSGTKHIKSTNKYIVTNEELNKRFLKCIMIGDAIWRKTIDRFSKDSLKVEASELIYAIYGITHEILHKHTPISKKKIDDFMSETIKENAEHSRNGAIAGGYIIQIFSESIGIKMNGSLKAIKNKIARENNGNVHV